ncbi:MAG: hypothetical protein LAP40_19325 [Acidobacteriia bacterium]|nr:hypothetical protein [Terriglobia bacterium]
MLYEDLRIEILAVAEESISKLDVLDPQGEDLDHPERAGAYRRHYFLRRSIGTLCEIATAIGHLDSDPDFQLIRATGGFEGFAKQTWDGAVEFFRTNESLIKKIRNDVGGHFGETAARHAIESFDSDTVGSIEVVFDQDGDPSDPRLHFAKSVVAAAIFRHLPGDQEEQFKQLMSEVIIKGYQQARDCVQVLTGIYLWPRFGRS